MRPRVAVLVWLVWLVWRRTCTYIQGQGPVPAGGWACDRAQSAVTFGQESTSSQPNGLAVQGCLCQGAEDKDEDEAERGRRKKRGGGGEPEGKDNSRRRGGEPDDAAAAAACRSDANDDEDRPMSCSVSLQTNKQARVAELSLS